MSHYDPMAQLPEGLAMALAQDPEALNAFGQLPGQEKSHYVERAHQVRSKAEMRALISELGDLHTH